MAAHPSLVKLSEEFRKDVIELAPNHYIAVGYAASNVHMIVGDDGVIIIDTTETTKAASNVFAEFRKITDKPVKTIILTHSHRDHISGASIFAEGGLPDIYASHHFKSDLVVVGEKRPTPTEIMIERTKRQFGMGLSWPEERVNLGVGPGDRPLEGMGQGFLPPTKLMPEGRHKILSCGVEIELMLAQGETPDHMIVWSPAHKVLFCGDNFYHSFPNLYAIRGTAYRDFNSWADTMDILSSFNAEILSPGHSRPIYGAQNIRSVLEDYRDAIRHVVSETAKGMNEGKSPDEIAQEIQLPTALADKPYLQEFYGKVSYAARAYFAGTVGWFDGNPTNLNRMAPATEAEKIITLAGGADRVLETAQKAHKKSDNQWALALCDRLIAVDHHREEATQIKISALRQMADKEINAPARNYYLVCAKDLAK